MDWVGVVQQLGFPIAACGLLAYAVWKACGWFANNVAKPMVEAHQTFLAGMLEAHKQLTGELKQQGGTLLAIARKLGIAADDQASKST